MAVPGSSPARSGPASRSHQVASDLLPLGLGRQQEEQSWGSAASHGMARPKVSGQAVPAGGSSGSGCASSTARRGCAVCPELASSRPPRRPGRAAGRITAPGFCPPLGTAARLRNVRGGTGWGPPARTKALRARLQQPPTAAAAGTAQPRAAAALEVPLRASSCSKSGPRAGPCAHRGRTLTFMVGGAVSGGDSGRSGTVTSELFSSSCFLKNQRQASASPRAGQQRQAGDKSLSSLAKPRAGRLLIK